jgi:cutinase
MSNAIPLLSADIRQRTVGGVLYGSTRGTIANYPKENWISLCASSDNVCAKRGTSGSQGSHLSYTSNGDIEKGADFLAKRIAATGGR